MKYDPGAVGPWRRASEGQGGQATRDEEEGGREAWERLAGTRSCAGLSEHTGQKSSGTFKFPLAGMRLYQGNEATEAGRGQILQVPECYTACFEFCSKVKGKPVMGFNTGREITIIVLSEIAQVDNR